MEEHSFNLIASTTAVDVGPFIVTVEKCRVARYSACEIDTQAHMGTTSIGSTRSSAGYRYSAGISSWHNAGAKEGPPLDSCRGGFCIFVWQSDHTKRASISLLRMENQDGHRLGVPLSLGGKNGPFGLRRWKLPKNE